MYLMAVMAEQDTVSQDDATHIVTLSPTERLEWLKNRTRFATLSSQVDNILSLYKTFLERTDAPKDKLITMFKDPNEYKDAFEKAKEFGDRVYELLCLIGQNNRIFRFLVV